MAFKVPACITVEVCTFVEDIKSLNVIVWNNWALPEIGEAFGLFTQSKEFSGLLLQVRWGFEQSDLVEGLPDHGRVGGTRCSLRSLLTQSILWLWFYRTDLREEIQKEIWSQLWLPTQIKWKSQKATSSNRMCHDPNPFLCSLALKDDALIFSSFLEEYCLKA